MNVHELKIPAALCRLIEAGVWPNADTPWQEINRQSFHPILGAEAAHSLSPDDDRIVMMKPPFHTIADEVAGGNDFWVSGLTNASEIDYDKAVIIADFGMGSDSPIILYYGDVDLPVVMYLRWIGNGNGNDIRHEWIQTHASFEEFAESVGFIESRGE
jgi:hypothetical protein